ncbi:unnamed protein product [Aphanomyces euteiches]|uniref:Uncharacterized protein n=1 Tax=Aphanomyces euteiches TaxID=100861 RepID=A0A6G0WVM3_9STRA|nr:hypothetical protein Ae201684_011196 [Aphanomyces euteiches]KAH9058755.1 hypothetical protein Ae201684P_006095 [Aphanomyces euteiches]KAH9133263.1 hypothetical protein AeRB84_020628 [Aphanomyces euteiches]
MSNDEVIWDWQTAPLAIVQEDDGGKIHLKSDGVTLLQTYDYPVAVVCLAGQDAEEAFQTIMECSIDAVSAPSRRKNGIYFLGSADFMRSGRCLLIFNVVLDLNIKTHSPLWDIALLMSSLMVYVDQSQSSLPPPRILDTLDVAQSLGHDCSADELKNFLSSFFWVTINPTTPSSFQTTSWPFSDPATTTRAGAFLHQLGWCTLPSLGSCAAPQACRDRILFETRVKSIFGTDLPGEMLVGLIDGALAHVDHAIDFFGAWNHVVGLKCQAIAATAFATYNDVLAESVTESPPMEFEMHDKLHGDLVQVALSIYSTQARFKKASQRRHHKQALQAKLHLTYMDHRAKLTAHSRRYCQDIAAKYMDEIVRASGDAISFQDTLGNFVTAYRSHAAGPAKDEVLASCITSELAAVFDQRQAAAKNAWTDAMLADERRQLEAAYEAKQRALTAHFEHEAAQLRTNIAAEQRMWTQMQAAKQSRENIGHHEAKRAQEALAAAQETILDLEEAAHKHKDDTITAQARIAALEAQIETQRNAITEEASLRASLVDNLAESIRHEKQLEEKLVAASEATTLATQDLTKQLRLVSEEKTLLQTKLQDLYLKVTALPETMQQLVLRPDDPPSEESVDFSDALRSYMS